MSPGRNVPNLGRMFIRLKYTDITQNTSIRSSTFTEIMAREKCGLLAVSRTVSVSRDVWAMAVRYIGARNDTIQQSEQTPDKKLEIKNINVYVSGNIETDPNGMLSPPTVWSFSVAMYSAWNLNDNYDISASVYVI